MTRFALLSSAALLAAAGAANAAVVANFEFDTNGDTEGFTGNNITGLDAQSGVLTGTAANNDPQLLVDFAPGLEAAAGESFDKVVFRVREFDDEANSFLTEFNATGLVVTINTSDLIVNAPSAFMAVDDGNGFFVVEVDISGFSGAINTLRVDPIGGAASNSNSQTQGNLFDVDYVRITDTAPVPEPASLGLIAAGGLMLARRRR